MSSKLIGYRFSPTVQEVLHVIEASKAPVTLQNVAWDDEINSITILATTPPTLGNDDVFYNSSYPIYVPSGSVSAYKAASRWNSLASRIQAIP